MADQHADLPARPRMEWLRKAAKEHLAELRVTEPTARLAQAQLGIARRFGFPSWRRLKAHVDAINTDAVRLTAAVTSGDLSVADDILRRWPRLIDAVDEGDDPVRPSDERGMRPLHLAVANDRPDMVRLLVAHGADLNVRNAGGRLPVHDCFELARDHIAELLFAAGTRPDVCAAAAYGRHDELTAILTDDPALANDLRTGLTPLGWCGFSGDVVAARILLEHGAIVDQSPFDMHAWGPTCQVARIEMARVLLAAGADPNARDAAGDTPLHRVLASRLVSDPAPMVSLLLDHGADPIRTNEAGIDPIQAAHAQIGQSFETYFPRRRLGAKDLDETLRLLLAARGG